MHSYSLIQLVELAGSCREHARLCSVADLTIAEACKHLERHILDSDIDTDEDEQMEDSQKLSVELCIRLSWSQSGREALNNADAWKHSLKGVLEALALIYDEADDEEWASSLSEMHHFVILCSDLLSCSASGPPLGSIHRAIFDSHYIIIRSYRRLRSIVILNRSRSEVDDKLLTSLSYLAARLSLDLEPLWRGRTATDKLKDLLNCSEQEFFLDVFEKRPALFPSSSPLTSPQRTALCYIFDSFLPSCTHVPRLRSEATSILGALVEARADEPGLGFPLLLAGDDLNIAQAIREGHWTISEGGTEQYEVTHTQLQQMFQEGKTIVIRSIGSRIKHLDGQNPLYSAIQLQHCLCNTLGFSSSSNLYITPPAMQGLSCHADDHDVFVIQISGSKRWLVKEPNNRDRLPLSYHPMPSHLPLDIADVGVQEFSLHPGDKLYLPRGWLHQAQAKEEASIHASISLEVCSEKCWGGLMHTALSLVMSQRGSADHDEEHCQRLHDWLEMRMDIDQRRDQRRVCPMLAADGEMSILLRSLTGTSSENTDGSSQSLFFSAWELLWSQILAQGPEIDMLSTPDRYLIIQCASRHDIALVAVDQWQRDLRTKTEVARGYEFAMSRLPETRGSEE